MAYIYHGKKESWWPLFFSDQIPEHSRTFQDNFGNFSRTFHLKIPGHCKYFGKFSRTSRFIKKLMRNLIIT